jgi:hypothetical protein
MDKKRISQEELDKLQDGQLLKVYWSGGNTGKFKVKVWENGNRYIYPAYIDDLKDKEYAKSLLRHSLHGLSNIHIHNIDIL